MTTNESAQKAPKPTPHNDLVELLLKDEILKGIPQETQGGVVVDRFIGQLARKKGVVGSNGERKTVSVILSDIDWATKQQAMGKGLSFNKALTVLSNTDGLRGAVDKLASDSRTGQYFGEMARRVGVDKEGQLTLKSVAQLEGYLFTDADDTSPQAATNWQSVILDRVNQYTSGKSDVSRWSAQAQELTSSDVDAVRQPQMEWNRAATDARRLGVDMELVARSAEAIRQLHDMQQPIGDVAMHGALPEFNYDHLFQP
jgi:hypothetical protein